MDVDNLKKINDTYGHEAGDRILHIMGDTLTDNSSDSLCCRLGGDEFLLFMKNVSCTEAEDRMTKIVGDFEKNKGDDPEIAIASISAGMVMCRKTHIKMRTTRLIKHYITSNRTERADLISIMMNTRHLRSITSMSINL